MLRTMTIFLVTAFLVALSGCATMQPQKELEMQGLRNQISILEAQLQGVQSQLQNKDQEVESQLRAKDEEITSLRESLDKTSQEKENLAKQRSQLSSVKTPLSVKPIQQALKNAGYDPGPIDGKMGRRTREALRNFQRDRNFMVTGKINRRTWQALRQYLSTKVK